MKKLITTLIIVAVLCLVGYFIKSWYDNRLNNDSRFASGNGRIEATEINIAARLPGKVEKIFVLEGDKVHAGQVLVAMQTDVLVANLAMAEAKLAQSTAKEESSKAQVSVLEAQLEARKADLEKIKAEYNFAENNYKRYSQLKASNATTEQHFQDMQKEYLAKKAEILSMDASIKETEANIKAAKADVLAAQANIKAAKAEMASISVDINDSILKAPLTGRVQYRVAEPGEVLQQGGRAINMVDLTDVYITFFLPEEVAGKVRIGADVRIVLDAIPKFPLPAKVSYVANVAQFTPKYVETKEERQKLMFRVKAHINRDILESFIDMVKTGLPGVAWVKLDESAPWPKELEVSENAKAKAQEIKAQLEKNALTPGQIIESNTRDLGRTTVLDTDKLQQQAKGLNKEETVKLEVKSMQTVNAVKKDSVEQSVKGAKDVADTKKDEIKENVSAAKKADEIDKKTVINGDAAK